MRKLFYKTFIFAHGIFICLGCMTVKSKKISLFSNEEDKLRWNEAVISGDLKKLMITTQKDETVPQCSPQKHATPQQYAPSYFEEMASCKITLPPQLIKSNIGNIDENGDCNLGISDSTEVVCHYHTGYEFTSKQNKELLENTIEIHCITFYLEENQKRGSLPLVYGLQLSCSPKTFPTSKHDLHLAENQNSKTCGESFYQLFSETNSLSPRCCRDGTLTKENADLKIRPSFSIASTQTQQVDCTKITENMHPHNPHRPHDQVGASYKN